MSANGPDVRKPPDRLIRWIWRIAIAVAILSAIGYFSSPTVSPLMCKIYG